MAKYRQPAVDAYDLHFYNWNVKNMGQSELEFSEADWNEVIQGCFELEEVIKEQHELIQEGLKGYRWSRRYLYSSLQKGRCDKRQPGQYEYE